MPCSPARWTSVLAAAALIALPLAASAQTPPPATPPPQQATPQTPPAQPPADPKPTEPQAQPPAQDGKVDAAAAKEHLGQARDTLSKLTSMPEAAKLEGDARTQVAQLISNFNELITTQTDWRAAYAKLDTGLTALLGPATPDQTTPPASGVTGAVGTSGAPTTQLDPGIRTKLAEFRTHLKEFERAAGSATGAMAPSVATDATANPANPNPANPATPTNPASAPTTPPSAATPPGAAPPASPTTSMTPADQTKAAEAVSNSEAEKHLDAISAILNASKTGALTKAQTTELKKHVEELRQVLQKK